LDFARSHIDITYLEGKTANVPIEPQQLHYPGFCGTVVFTVYEPSPEHKPYLQALDQLALFANYAGTGTQTMRGMGVTRVKRYDRLSSKTTGLQGRATHTEQIGKKAETTHF
jgi:hypothetical protein